MSAIIYLFHNKPAKWVWLVPFDSWGSCGKPNFTSSLSLSLNIYKMGTAILPSQDIQLKWPINHQIIWLYSSEAEISLLCMTNESSFLEYQVSQNSHYLWKVPIITSFWPFWPPAGQSRSGCSYLPRAAMAFLSGSSLLQMQPCSDRKSSPQRTSAFRQKQLGWGGVGW